LIIFIVGAIGHGVWNILRGTADVDDAGNNFQGISKRIIAGGIGFFYLFLAWTAWRIVTTAQITVENVTIQKSIIAIILALPLGTILVTFIGFAVIGAGINECYRGLTGKYQEDFRMYELLANGQKIITVLGALSFTARAVIFGLIGYFFIMAAIESNPNEAVGLDGALLTLAQSYYGKVLLFIASIGLLAHGVLSLYEAHYRRIC